MLPLGVKVQTHDLATGIDAPCPGVNRPWENDRGDNALSQKIPAPHRPWVIHTHYFTRRVNAEGPSTRRWGRVEIGEHAPTEQHAVGNPVAIPIAPDDFALRINVVHLGHPGVWNIN